MVPFLIGFLISLALGLCSGNLLAGIKFKKDFDTVYSFKQFKFHTMPDKNLTENMSVEVLLRQASEPYEVIVNLRNFTAQDPIVKLREKDLAEVLTPFVVRLQENGELKYLVTAQNESFTSIAVKNTVLRAVFSDVLKYKSYLKNSSQLANFTSNWDFIKLAMINCNASIDLDEKSEDFGLNFTSNPSMCEKGYFSMPEDFFPEGSLKLRSKFSKEDFSLLERCECSKVTAKLSDDVTDMEYRYKLRFEGFREQEKVELEKIDAVHDAHVLPEFIAYLNEALHTLFFGKPLRSLFLLGIQQRSG